MEYKPESEVKTVEEIGLDGHHKVILSKLRRGYDAPSFMEHIQLERASMVIKMKMHENDLLRKSARDNYSITTLFNLRGGSIGGKHLSNASNMTELRNLTNIGETMLANFGELHNVTRLTPPEKKDISDIHALAMLISYGITILGEFTPAKTMNSFMIKEYSKMALSFINGTRKYPTIPVKSKPNDPHNVDGRLHGNLRLSNITGVADIRKIVESIDRSQDDKQIIFNAIAGNNATEIATKADSIKFPGPYNCFTGRAITTEAVIMYHIRQIYNLTKQLRELSIVHSQTDH